MFYNVFSYNLEDFKYKFLAIIDAVLSKDGYT